MAKRLKPLKWNKRVLGDCVEPEYTSRLMIKSWKIWTFKKNRQGVAFLSNDVRVQQPTLHGLVLCASCWYCSFSWHQIVVCQCNLIDFTEHILTRACHCSILHTQEPFLAYWGSIAWPWWVSETIESNAHIGCVFSCMCIRQTLINKLGRGRC